MTAWRISRWRFVLGERCEAEVAMAGTGRAIWRLRRPRSASAATIAPLWTRPLAASPRRPSAEMRPGPFRGSLQHRLAPFALDRQDRRHRGEAGFGRRGGDPLDALRGRRLAHEEVVNRPLRAMAFAAQREAAGDRGRRIEAPVS